MNRFIYYYSVFDIRVNQTQGEPHQPPLHCLVYLKMGTLLVRLASEMLQLYAGTLKCSKNITASLILHKN